MIKKLVFSLSVIGIVILVMSGCRTDTMTAPSVSGGAAENSPAPSITIPGLVNNLLTVHLIPLPQGNGKGNIVSSTQLVTPEFGGKITLLANYRASNGKLVSRIAVFTVPSHAVNRAVPITMTFDTTNAAVQFEPSGLVFNKPASLDFKVTGLGLLQSGIGFYCIGDNGNVQLEPVLNLLLNLLTGSIDLEGGTVPHFSRYGFGR